MVIRVQCACGKTIKADDKHAVKLARCPECREMVPLPGGASKTSAGVTTLTDGTVCLQALCPCGRVLRTSLDNAGKAARCPECGEVVPLPAIRKQVARGDDAGGESSRQRRAVPASKLDEGASPGLDGDGLDWDSLPEPEERVAKPKRRKKTVAEEAEDDEDAPRIHRKKSKRDEEESGSKTLLILGGIGTFVVTAGLVALLVFFMPQPGGKKADDDKPGELPKGMEFVPFNHEIVHIQTVYPKGWQTRGSGGSGGVPPVAILEDGTARVEFRANQRGSATAMIMQPNPDPTKKIPDSMKPVSRIHEDNRARYEEDIPGYTEVGEPKMVKVKGFNGEGRLSNYTCKVGLFGSARGYRVTLIGSDQWNVFLQCPYDDWKKYQPIFDKMLENASGG
ncbi:MAG: hypothetical protein U0903_06035 [Planctomycetales bacterium]